MFSVHKVKEVKKRHSNRVLSLFITVVLILQVIPVYAFEGGMIPIPEDVVNLSGNEEFLSEKENSTDGVDPKYSEIIVKYKENASKGGYRTMGIGSADLQLIDVTSEENMDQTLEVLHNDPQVEYAEPNYVFEAQWLEDDMVPLDEYYSQQWAFHHSQLDPVYAWACALDSLFDKATTADGDGNESNPYDLNGNLSLDSGDDLNGLYGEAGEVITAVIDTGIDSFHEELEDKVLPGYNAITDKLDINIPGSTMDDSRNGHGTHLAGVMAANYSNSLAHGTGKGIAGVTGTFPIKLLPVKVLDSAGIGSMYHIAKGITWAVDHGAQVINLSLGARLPDYPRTLADAVKYAQDRGVLVVAAAGNDGGRVEHFYPASLPGVVSAAASQEDHHLASFSNQGALVNAPGVDIISTLPGNTYGKLSGTSQAAAYVSGAAALYRSVYPDRNMEMVSRALKLGQHDYPEGCTYHWWGTVCTSHNYVLNMAEMVYENSVPYNVVEILEPSSQSYEGPRLSGESTVLVKIDDVADARRVVFSLEKDGRSDEGVLLDDINVEDGEHIPDSGLLSIHWDTTPFENGKYVLRVRYFYEEDGYTYDYDASMDVVIDNETSKSLIIQVVKPNGEPASRAWVTVHHPFVEYDAYNESDYMNYEEVWHGQADIDGNVVISGIEAISENDFLVTARGSDPGFFYYKMVRPPGIATLDGNDAIRVTISGRNVEDFPLSGSMILLEMLEGNLPNGVNPSEIIHLDDDADEIPITTLDGEGTSEVYITKGSYNIRLLNANEIYYLVKLGYEITNLTGEISFAPGPEEVAAIKLVPEEGFTKASFLLKDEGDSFIGFNNIDMSKAATVYPGKYSTVIEAVYSNSVNSKEYLLTLDTPTVQLSPGEEYHLQFGPPIHGTLKNNEYWFQDGYWKASHTAYFDVTFPDRYGNLVKHLYTQPISSLSINSGARDTADKSILIHEQEKPILGNDSIVVNDEQAKMYAYNNLTGNFELYNQAADQIVPYFEFKDSDGNLITGGSRGINISYGFDAEWANAHWDIPYTLAAGIYTAAAKLDAGILSENGVTAESPSLSFEIREQEVVGVHPDITVTVINRAGTPMMSAEIMLLEKIDNKAYYPVPYTVGYTDVNGVARFEDLDLDPNKEYGLLTMGLSDPAQPCNPAEMVMLFNPIAYDGEPVSLTINAQNKEMHRIELQPRDQNGNTFPSDRIYAAYGYDSDGVPFGRMFTESYDENLVLWVPDGDYTFQAFVNEETDWWNMEEEYAPLYLLSEKVHVPSEIAENGIVTLGGQGLAALDIDGSVMSGNAVECYTPSIAVFPEDIPLSPVLYIQALGEKYNDDDERIEFIQKRLVYAAPGNYRIQAGFVHRHFNGEWDYWLEKACTLGEGETLQINVDDHFQGNIDADKSSYGIAERIEFNNDIRDSFGNRLVAAVIGMELEGGGSIGNSLGIGNQDAGAQNHEEIAPFITIYNSQGEEVYHYKDAGENYGLLRELWQYWSRFSFAPMMILDGGSTFFDGSYPIPEDINGGMYRACLALPTGVHTYQPADEQFSINAAPGAPILEELQSPTNANAVSIKGTGLPGALMHVYYSRNGGADVLAGTTTADASIGSFSMDVDLPDEGSYSFTAAAEANGMTGEKSPGILLVVDRTPPEAPVNLQGTSPDETHINLTWNAPAGEEISRYEVSRDGVVIVHEVTGGENLSYQDSGLVKNTEYHYGIVAIDKAGNKSQEVSITVRTVVGADTEAPSPPVNLQALLDKLTVKLTWEAAADNVGIAGYKVYRFKMINSETGEEELEKTEDVQNVLEYTDEALAPNTTYAYIVTSYDEAGNESIKEGDTAPKASITTNDLAISSIRWQGVKDRNGLLVPESSLKLTLVGDKGQQAFVDIEYTAWDSMGELKVHKLQLTEDKDEQDQGLGIYRGVFTIPKGVSKLVSVMGAFGNGSDYHITKYADGLPLDFSGRISITIDGPEHDALNGGQLVIWSASKSCGAKLTLNGPDTYHFDRLVPSDDYSVRVLTGDNVLLKEEKNISISSGYTSQITVKPNLPAALYLRVVDDEGNKLNNVGVTVMADTGAILARGSSGSDGWVKNNRESNTQERQPVLKSQLSGSNITVSVSSMDNLWQTYSLPVPVNIILEPGNNEKEIILFKHPKAIVKGTVSLDTNDSIEPLKDVVINVSQIIDGRTVTKSTKTDANGFYTIEVYTGKVKITTSHRLLHNEEFELDHLTEGEERVHNVAGVMQKSITLNVFTQRIGQPEYEMDMDWRAAVHLHLKGKNLGQEGNEKNLPFSIRHEYLQIPIPDPEPGDMIEITADGYEGNMTKDTVRITLNENAWGRAQVHLYERGKIGAIVRDSSGKSHEGEVRFMEVFRETEQGKVFVKTFKAAAAEAVTGGLDEGSYTVVYHWRSLPLHYIKNGRWVYPQRNYEDMISYLGEEYTVRENIEVKNAEQVDLGPIVLPYPVQLEAGYFRGQEGNDFTASRYETGPGSIITMRASYRYEAGEPAPQDLKLCLGIPQKAELIQNSVTVRAAQGPNEPLISQRPDCIEIDFGDSAADGIEGVVLYRVQMSDSPDWPSAAAKAWAEFMINGKEKQEDIADLVIDVPYVSLTAPNDIWERENVPVSGRSPAGAVVKIYDGYYYLTETAASANGNWQATVTLPDRGIKAKHWLRAEATAPVEIGDEIPPDWGANSRISAADIQRKSVNLTWPAASDNVGVTGYIITGYYGDGTVALTRAAADTQIHIQGLEPGTKYTFKVEAEDEKFNISSDGPDISVTTIPPDLSSPEWQGNELVISEIKLNSVKLTWPLAADNEMKEYRVTGVSQNGNAIEPAVFDPYTTSTTINGLENGKEYTFTVEAVDHSGNTSRLTKAAATVLVDNAVPVWPGNAAITVDLLLQDRLEMSWPEAADNIDVYRYTIYLQQEDGQFVQTGTQYTNSDRRNNLTPETVYTFKIEATDAAGNCTENGPVVTVTTPPRDRTAPVWPDGAEITVSERTQYGMRLSWPSAIDDQSPVEYRLIYHDGENDWVYGSGLISGFERGDVTSWRVYASDIYGNTNPVPLTLTYEIQPEDQIPPTWPAGSRVEALEVGFQNALLRWTPTNDDDCLKYNLYVYDVNNNVVASTSVGKQINEWWVGNIYEMFPGHTYTCKVQAVDEFDNVSTDGPSLVISTITDDTRPPQWPGGSKLEVLEFYSGTAVGLTWTLARDFQLKYYVLTGMDSHGNDVESCPIETMQTAWHVWGLTPGETYTLQVNAVDFEGNKSVDGPTCTVTVPLSQGAAASMSIQGNSYEFKAQDIVNTKLMYSTPTSVTYDKDQPRINSVTMNQLGSRSITFGPVGKFPYVYVPSQSFNFDIDFNDNSRISDLNVHAENGAKLGGGNAPGQSITGILNGSRTIPGRIYASYSVLPKTWTGDGIAPQLDEGIARSGMTNAWRDASVSAETIDGNTEKITMLLGGDENKKMETTVSIKPHAGGGLGQIPVGEAPANITSWNYDASSGQISFHITAIISGDKIRAGVPAALADGGEAAEYAVEVGLKTIIHSEYPELDLLETLKGGYDYLQYLDELQGLLDRVYTECDPRFNRDIYRQFIEDEAKRSLQDLMFKYTMTLCGIGIGSGAGPLGSFAFGYISNLIGDKVDSDQKGRFNHIKQLIDDNPYCKPDVEDYIKKLLADPTWILDPSGYVYEAVEYNRLEDVEATALQKVGNDWFTWDAAWFEQENPLMTDQNGRYAWDVPEGLWQVLFEKEGYETAKSDELPVPPPQTDVNIGMVSLEAPEIVDVTASSDDNCIDILFDKYMLVDTVDISGINVAPDPEEEDGTNEIPGVLEPLNPENDPQDNNVKLSRSYRFTPDTSIAAGEKYSIWVSQMVQSYSGRFMDEDFNQVITAASEGTVEVEDVTNAKVVSGDGTLKVTWEDPNIPNVEKIRIYYRESSASEYSSPIDISKGIEEYLIINIVNETEYTIKIVVLDAWGNSSRGVTVTGIPIKKENNPGSNIRNIILPTPGEELFEVDSKAKIINAFEDKITLEIQEGAFDSKISLTLRIIDEPVSLSRGMKNYSTVFDIDTGGVLPKKPIILKLKYQDSSNIDLRKLAIYRQDDGDKTKWTYMGGVVDTSTGVITVQLKSFSRYGVMSYDHGFKDLDGHWSKRDVDVLVSRNIVKGVSETEFQPDRNITRAEIATLLVELMNTAAGTCLQGNSGTLPFFDDVSPDAWYFDHIQAAAAYGIIRGDGRSFRPKDPVTREEMAVMLDKILGLEENPGNQAADRVFKDVDMISSWASGSVKNVKALGLMNGMTEDEFAPKDKATRAQAAVVILKMMEKLGLVTAVNTFNGKISISNIEGEHLELIQSKGDIQTKYVLMPDNEEVKQELYSAVGREIEIIASLKSEANIFMSGPVLKVFWAENRPKLPGG